MNESQEAVEIHRGASKKRADELALVLTARHIPHARQRLPDGEQVLLVHPHHADRAVAELRQFDHENEGWPPAEFDDVRLSRGLGSALAWVVVLTYIFFLQQTESWGLTWTDAGRTEADAIRDGEWWRTITALSLHADVVHLAGNVVFGALFVAATCQVLGTGVGLFSVLMSGCLGNLANAYIQSPEHRSLGASTAVFGALGILVAYQWHRRVRRRIKPLRRWTPPIVGVIFLGFLGMSGERTDVMAHVTGFGAGALIGLALGHFGVRLLERRRLQIVYGLLAPALLIAAWALAFDGPR